MTVCDIEKKLFELSDEEYRSFQANLIPDIEEKTIIGVRVPILRKLAADIVKEHSEGEFLESLPHKYHDENMLHALILNELREPNKLFAKLDEFLPYVDNWAVCDTIKPKLFKKLHAQIWERIPGYLDMENTYAVRFGIGMLMAHFLDEDFKEEALGLVYDVKIDEYYVRMMQAWFFATALANRYESAVAYFERGMGDRELLSMTFKKCKESHRISEERCAQLKEIMKSID